MHVVTTVLDIVITLVTLYNLFIGSLKWPESHSDTARISLSLFFCH